MAWRIEVNLKPGIVDARGKSFINKIHDFLGIAVDDIVTSDVYTVDISMTKAQIQQAMTGPLCDPVIQTARINPPFDAAFDFYLEVGFLPGVTDNVGTTARQAIATMLGKKLKPGESVYTSTLFAFKGKQLKRADIERIANEFLHNPLIQQFHMYTPTEKAKIYIPKVSLKQRVRVETVDLSKMSDDELMRLSRERLLALNIRELRLIQKFFQRRDLITRRKRRGLGAKITDVELEALAQTWSEHCKHKIFNAIIDYIDENGKKEKIKSLFKTYIKGSTEKIRKTRGDDFLVSVFVDNAGVITFDKDWNLVFKVETHNSPSALDPYGGALTGIVGVNRDVLGTGMGARLIFNTDVFCFADPFYPEKLPPRILHPRRIYDGVVTGVEHGGNKSGIPTVNGSIVFDNKYLGKPLVYCGTGGIMPKVINKKKSHKKSIDPGDLIVMSGGRIGKDGIHGATFSSEELHEGSPATAVQIGDPITQKKMADFLYVARDMGLYNAITDNGAGGLSSSVGEMAQLCDGCEIHLEKPPLKYHGLNPWEILVSESQERMSLAVPKKNLNEFLALSKKYDVESTVIGKFTDSGYFHALYKGKTVAYLPLDFFHGGLLDMELTARFDKPQHTLKPMVPQPSDCGTLLKSLLSSLNICSKESVVRKYDHEVQGMSVIKPLTGIYNDGPSDAAVIKPLAESNRGAVISHGICPKFSEYDTYNMSALALDEAVRNAVAVGGNIDAMACLDNFCWCDPIKSEKNPDGEHKLAQLVRANKALYDHTTAYGVPCISGKDSMKNDYIMGNIKISVPPTLLFSLIGIIDDVRQCTTMDLKRAGDSIYIAGKTSDEMAGSEYLRILNITGGKVPAVDAGLNKEIYRRMHSGIAQGLINACHDCSDGGTGVCIAEMAFAGGLGCEINFENIPYEGEFREDYLLFSESAGRLVFTVPAGKEAEAEKLFAGLPCAKIGTVTDSGKVEFLHHGKMLVNESIADLKECWQKTLREI